MRVKKPHIHAEVIKAWADGATVECAFSDDERWIISVNPDWCTHLRYRVKPEPELPKTTLSQKTLWDFYARQPRFSAGADLLDTVNMALKHFVESGQMDAYIAQRDIKERDNANN